MKNENKCSNSGGWFNVHVFGSVCAHQSWEGLTQQQGKAAKYNRCTTPNSSYSHVQTIWSVLKKALYSTSAGLGLKDKSSKGPRFANTGAIIIADWRKKKKQIFVPCLLLSF